MIDITAASNCDGVCEQLKWKYGEEADAALAEYFKELQNEWAVQIAQISGYRNESDKAFDWLEHSYKQRDSGLAEMKGDPLLRSLERDPRYRAFLQKMKLPVN